MPESGHAEHGAGKETRPVDRAATDSGSDEEIAWPGWPSDCTLSPDVRKRMEQGWRLLTRYGMELRPCRLLPPAAFSAELAPLNPGHWFWPRVDPKRTAEKSAAVGFRLGLSCAGWVEQPTTEEFYAAVHTQEPTARQKTIVYGWVLEATDIDLIRAWAERAYSWRTLVRALHKAGFDVYPRIKVLNELAETPPDIDGVRT